MLIQDKVTWDADIEKNLALMNTLGVDCVSMVQSEMGSDFYKNTILSKSIDVPAHLTGFSHPIRVSRAP